LWTLATTGQDRFVIGDTNDRRSTMVVSEGGCNQLLTKTREHLSMNQAVEDGNGSGVVTRLRNATNDAIKTVVAILMISCALVVLIRGNYRMEQIEIKVDQVAKEVEFLAVELRKTPSQTEADSGI
jgi:hypothetical protein